MKSTTLLSSRVEPDLRDATENTLDEAETRSGRVDRSVHNGFELPCIPGEFIARGIASRDAAQGTGDYAPASEVVKKLEHRLNALRDTKQERR